MAGEGIQGIDRESWQVRLLKLPKGHSRGTALGFCGGNAVGRVERLRSPSIGCWWPGGAPELLVLEGRETVAAGRARGSTIPGQWFDGKSGAMGAAAWEWDGERLAARALFAEACERSWATAAGGGVVIGMGSPRGQKGRYCPTVGLLWREGAEAVSVEAQRDVALNATDGVRLAGNVRGRAMLWPTASDDPIDLTPAGMMMAEVQSLDGDLQVGLAYKGMRAHAALWRGTAASFLNLTPRGFQTAAAYGGAGGYQVGSVREKENTRNGTPGSDNRAVLWQGAADRWLDLNALLPSETYNASIAWAIEVEDDVLRICGEAIRYEVERAGTAHESHVVPVAHPVVWTARLAGA